jgi:hypothetical protein
MKWMIGHELEESGSPTISSITHLVRHQLASWVGRNRVGRVERCPGLDRGL